jgi:tetratricopeptide (TPR) repeat protein
MRSAVCRSCCSLDDFSDSALVWSCMFWLAAALVVGLTLGCVLARTAHAQDEPEAGSVFHSSDPLAPAEERLQDVLEALPALLLSSRWPEAIALVESSELDPADAMALQGFVLLRSDSPELARVAFLEALEARPERLGIWLYVAQCAVALGEAAAALDAYQRGLSAGRDVSAVWLLGAQIEVLGGNVFRAWDVLAVAESRFGHLPDADLLRTQILSQLDVRWSMVPWQLTRVVGLAEACRWWSATRSQDDSAGLPTQGRRETSRVQDGQLLWVGTTGLWAHACDAGLRRVRPVREGLTFLQGGGDSGLDDRIRRLAQSGQCERALALGAVYPAEVATETQPWLSWCASLQ